MNKLKFAATSIFTLFCGMFLVSGSALAAIDLTGVTFPLTECEAIAALVLAALAGLWVIRKVLSLVRGR